MEETVRDRINKLYTDMYFGDGKENPSMTTRMTMVEEKLEKLSNLIDKLLWAVAGTVFAVIGEVVLRVLKLLCILAIVSIACSAQKNEAAAYAFGNFNPAYFAFQETIFAGDNTPAIGYGLDYTRTLSKHNGIGILAGQDNVLAELYAGNNQFFRWKLRRYEVSILAQQQFMHKNLIGFIFEGPGTIITNGGAKESGVSANLSVVTGFGFEYMFSKHLGSRTRVSFEDSNTGCYEDKNCSQARWSVAQDLWSGLSFRW